jgi:hypothetical protein
MNDLSQNLLVAAKDTSDALDTLAPAILEAIFVHHRSQRWVARYLNENGYKISHVSISRYLKKANENWTSVLDEVTGDACTANRRAEVCWLAPTYLAFRTHKGTFWVKTPPIPSANDLQTEAKSLLEKLELAGLIAIETTPKGFTIIPKMNLHAGTKVTA